MPPGLVEQVYAIDELDRNAGGDGFPLAMSAIKNAQDADERLKRVMADVRYKEKFGVLPFGSAEVVTFNGVIWVPKDIAEGIISWYHENLGHPGVTRTVRTISQNFGWKGLRADVERYIKHCDECQRHKIVGKRQYGKIPLNDSLGDKDPFEKVHVDCIGPWTISMYDPGLEKEAKYQIQAMCMIDAGSHLIEIGLIPTANSYSCAIVFDTQWLCRYPRPSKVGHDNGKEFMGEEFQELLRSYDITPEPTTVKNPTANALVERANLSIGDQLRIRKFNIEHWEEDAVHMLQAVAWALNTTTPSNMPYSPGQLVFGMDMIFRQKVKIDWAIIKKERRRQTVANNRKENKTRLEYEYKVGDMVLIVDKPYERAKKAKLSTPTEGPYEILRIYANGNVRIRRGNYDEDISIRRLRPYFAA